MEMTDGFFWDGYLHWAHDIEEKDKEFKHTGESPLYEPIFVRLKISEIWVPILSKLLDKILDESDADSAFVGQVTQEEGLNFLKDFAFDLVELTVGFNHALVTRTSPEFFIYRPVAKTQEDHDYYSCYFSVLDVGAPARVNLNPTVVKPVTKFMAFQSTKPIGGIIDNDIGYLNRAFRYSDNTTRIASIWLQARERLNDTSSPHFQRMHIGQVLNADRINSLIRTYGRNERQAYASVNANLHSRSAYKHAPPIVAHGSMVADLAFGNRENNLMQDIPLLAVQIPPESAFDTSGTMSESYIVQGVRWICFWARKNYPERPVVINISYGVIAGQKDGGKFIEAQIAREIDIASQYIPSQKVEIVFAFGNSRNEKQVAELSVAPKDPQDTTKYQQDIKWMIPFDNPAPAFVEIRAIAQSRLTDVPDTTTISLTAPDGTRTFLTGSAGTNSTAAHPHVSVKGGTAPARIYNIPRRAFDRRPPQPGYTLAAVGPTRTHGHQLPVAKCGDWTISICNTGDAEVRVILQIQRGDTAPGFRDGGRQSHFEGPFVRENSDGVAGRTVVPPLTNAGTNNAFANVAAFNTAGADRNVFGNLVPAPYSGQGAKWTKELEPDERKHVDNTFTTGVRTSGAYSGTQVRLSGSSAAAAKLTRELIENPKP